MKIYSLTDLCVKRVLTALKWTPMQTDRKKPFGGSKSLKEITDQYNEIFPPSILGKIIGMYQSESNVRSILNFLITKELVKKELLSFTDRYHKTPKVHYRPIKQGSDPDGHKRP